MLTTQLNHIASLAKWLSVRLRTTQLWVLIPLQPLKLPISRLFGASSLLTFRQLQSVDSPKTSMWHNKDTQTNALASLAKLLCVGIETKWLWVRIPLQWDSLLPYMNLFLPTTEFIMEITTVAYNTAFRIQLTLSKIIVDVMDSPFLSTLWS